MEADSEWYPWGWGQTPEDRCEVYKSHISLAGVGQNFVILLAFFFFIEILGKRMFYILFFAGISGFAVAVLIGLLIGFMSGLLFIQTTFKVQKIRNILTNAWNLLWQ